MDEVKSTNWLNSFEPRCENILRFDTNVNSEYAVGRDDPTQRNVYKHEDTVNEKHTKFTLFLLSVVEIASNYFNSFHNSWSITETKKKNSILLTTKMKTFILTDY